MRNHADGTPGVPSPSNVFTSEFLRRFDEQDEPAVAAEAAVSGLGAVETLPDGRFAVHLSGGGEERDLVGVFRERWRALVTAAVLPGTGRDPLVVLRKEADPEGYALLAGLDLDGRPDVVGHLCLFDDTLAIALHVAEALMRTPECMAAVLEASGKVAVERTGTHLDRRLPAVVP
jgi:hypothetical protein